MNQRTLRRLLTAAILLSGAFGLLCLTRNAQIEGVLWFILATLLDIVKWTHDKLICTGTHSTGPHYFSPTTPYIANRDNQNTCIQCATSYDRYLLRTYLEKKLEWTLIDAPPKAVSDGTERVGRKRLGDLLVKEKVITSEQLEQATKFAKDTHTRPESALVKLGFLSNEDVTNFLSRQYGVPAINSLSYLNIDPAVVKLIPYETAKWLQILPLSRVGASLTIAMVDPTNVFAMDEIKFMTGFNIEPVVASESSIIEGIGKAYGTSKDGTQR